MKPIKNSVALVIYNDDHSKFLTVRRPPDDDSLPNIWGLPAGSLKDRETFEAAVIRSAKDKLGVAVKIISLISEGEIERDQHILQMKEFEVIIENGIPVVPQTTPGVTQYVEWKWGAADDLVEAARQGSLCSRIYLESVNRSW